jgi:cytolysin (calcineurin-like family phosphatase)
MKALTEKQAFWKRHLEAAHSYEGSLADYARAHDLSAKKLYSYKTRIRKREAAAEISTEFVKVRAEAVASLSPVTVTLPNGVRLTFSDIDAPGLLERLAGL